MASQQWSAGRIGIVLTVAGIATVLARGPAGAFVDATMRKRTLIAASALCWYRRGDYGACGPCSGL